MNSSEDPHRGSSANPRPARSLGPALVLIVMGALVLLGGPLLIRNLEFARQQATVDLATNRLALGNPLTALNQATRDLATKVEPSVVHVSTRGSLREPGSALGGYYTSSGSGWIYDDQGHVVTNAHVIAPADVIEVQLATGEVRTATFVGSDMRSDIAVVRISPDRLLPAERSDVLPEQGDLVFAFGSPFDFRFSMSSGIVSGLSRTAGIDELDFENFIQVDAAVNPGNSGGPLSDIAGKVIGMNTAIATGRGTNVGDGQFAGIGLAIPIRMIELVVDQLIETGEVSKGFLGISMLELDMLRSVRSLPETEQRILDEFDGLGVLIESVQPGFPAERIDIRSGDVLMAVDGISVESIDNVRAQIGLRRPATIVELKIWRWNESEGVPAEFLVDVELGRLDPKSNYQRQVALLRRAGFNGLATLTPMLARERGVDWQPGILVPERAQSGFLSRTVDAGSVINRVGRDSVSNEEDLYARLRQAENQSRYRGGTRVVELGISSPDGEPLIVQMKLP
ncbi:MAG: trypsin-like peptidase domain-containing protein [Phycisphaerales bacterium]|nr:trypsin-like peptidase domain-containing protein [Phycisphaerales bacterium]